MRFDSQVCLVSGQPAPNLVPLLDEQLAPRKVALVVSPDMKSQAEWLEKVIRRKGMGVESIEVLDAYDYYGIADGVMDWLVRQGNAQVALNVTGGTKVMALAAQSVFQAAGQPVFYVNAVSDEVLWLGARSPSYALPQKIRLREYLEIHGYSVQSMSKPEIPARLRNLAEHLVGNVKDLGAALGILNSLAKSAENRSKSTPIPPRHLGNPGLNEIIELFRAEDLLRVTDDQLVFPDETARQFVNGGWLEFHVFRILADIAPTQNMVDYAINFNIVAPDGKTRNEIDAAFMSGNRLHLIECKTANLVALSDRGESKATEAIYKLESLHKTGGLRTRGMLIDYRGGLSSADLTRAGQVGIEVVSAAALSNLKNRIQAWIQDESKSAKNQLKQRPV